MEQIFWLLQSLQSPAVFEKINTIAFQPEDRGFKTFHRRLTFPSDSHLLAATLFLQVMHTTVQLIKEINDKTIILLLTKMSVSGQVANFYPFTLFDPWLRSKSVWLSGWKYSFVSQNLKMRVTRTFTVWFLRLLGKWLKVPVCLVIYVYVSEKRKHFPKEIKMLSHLPSRSH